MTPLKTSDIAKMIARLVVGVPGLFRRPRWSEERIEAYQLQHLKARLAEAKAKVPLYQQRGLPDPEAIQSLKDWAKLPLTTKKDLLDRPTEARLNPDFRIGDLILSKSSGSTGQALDVYYDRESFYYFVLAGFRLYIMAFRYWPWRRQTYIYTSPYPFTSIFGAYPMHFISTLTPLDETLENLRRKPPALLVCYPSHLRSLIDQMGPEDFKRIKPKAINVNSEMSSASERAFFAKALSTFVFDDYSSEELVRIASQCKHLRYHVFDDVNYIEIVDNNGNLVPDGTVGNIVGTNLHNRAMPLLRYVQGDRGAIRPSDCPCGRQFRILEKLEGRRNDAFLLPNGRLLSSGFLLDLTYDIFLSYENAAREFCLVQDRPELWTLELVPGAKWDESLATIIPRNLAAKLNQPTVTIELKIVDKVTHTASGKANPIISRVKKNP